MHLIKKLKINIFIDINVIISKSIIIDLIKKKIVIQNCDIIVFLEIRFRFNHVQQRFIHVKKIITLFSRNQLIIFVHYFVDDLSNNRNFLFESKNTNIILYTHVIDVFIKVVLVINDTNKIVRIFRNCRLSKLIELDFSHVFYVENNDNFAKLIIRKLKFEHKSFWFKKIIFVFVAIAIVTSTITFSTFVISIDF